MEILPLSPIWMSQPSNTVFLLIRGVLPCLPSYVRFIFGKRRFSWVIAPRNICSQVYNPRCPICTTHWAAGPVLTIAIKRLVFNMWLASHNYWAETPSPSHCTDTHIQNHKLSSSGSLEVSILQLSVGKLTCDSVNEKVTRNIPTGEWITLLSWWWQQLMMWTVMMRTLAALFVQSLYDLNDL